jgi:hypothetical protein
MNNTELDQLVNRFRTNKERIETKAIDLNNLIREQKQIEDTMYMFLSMRYPDISDVVNRVKSYTQKQIEDFINKNKEAQ